MRRSRGGTDVQTNRRQTSNAPAVLPTPSATRATPERHGVPPPRSGALQLSTNRGWPEANAEREALGVHWG